MVYSNASYGAITTHERTWFLKIELKQQPELYISKSFAPADILKPTFYVLYQSVIQQRYPAVDIRVPILKARQIQNKEENEKSQENDQASKETKAGQNNDNVNNNCNLSDSHVDNNYNCTTTCAKEVSSSPGWWSRDEHIRFNMIFVCCPGKTEIIASCLTGDLCKVKINDDLSVVVKHYEEYEIEDEMDEKNLKARRHIDNEVCIYTHLHLLSADWPSHVPVLHYAGVFLSFRGVIISFIKGKVVKFSKMTQEQRVACESALKELHEYKLLHGDIHYRNFVINSENKAYILDFGFTKVCSNDELFEKERMLLRGKLQELDNSVTQVVKPNRRNRQCNRNEYTNGNSIAAK
jgi:tRNA A-37 threonylcarbamoyl transferase component Bud32